MSGDFLIVTNVLSQLMRPRPTQQVVNLWQSH